MRARFLRGILKKIQLMTENTCINIISNVFKTFDDDVLG
jgi:hypothetical protein